MDHSAILKQKLLMKLTSFRFRKFLKVFSQKKFTDE